VPFSDETIFANECRCFQERRLSRRSRFAMHKREDGYFSGQEATMSRPNHRARTNHRAIRAALSAALALTLMLIAGAAAG